MVITGPDGPPQSGLILIDLARINHSRITAFPDTVHGNQARRLLIVLVSNQQVTFHMNPIAGVNGFQLPVVVGGGLQESLTHELLLPKLTGIESLFFSIRNQVDPELFERQPERNRQPYPKGQCLEISNAVKQKLADPTALLNAGLNPAARTGLEVFSEFRERGGIFRQVWGDLRGKYFQNAFQLGTLYVDVANDTVVTTKPKVEILPFSESGLSPIANFQHYEQIGRIYCNDQYYPNHLLPDLAPYFPLVCITENGTVCFLSEFNYMLWLTLENRFRPSQAYLAKGALPSTLFHRLHPTLGKLGYRIAKSPEDGRKKALAACNELRRKRRYMNARDTFWALSAIRVVNNSLIQQGRYFA